MMSFAHSIQGEVVYAEKYRLTDGIDLLTRAGVEVEYKSLEDGSSSSSASL